ncbi:DNA replication regulator SLD2 [Cladobotryum mycophilum]|uniref:DNA replication regulator SLD2 n=1 Tax=Cladobotryum mycophilum TaxID=491253 RepID=A0ABR0SUT9_9HYPO
MDEQTKREYEARAQRVRADLKQWEADWAQSHDGQKPGREDIKNTPSIAQKYKDYNKLRDIISGKIVPTAASSAKREPGSTKRKPDAPSPVETPLKKAKHLETPSKGESYTDNDGHMNSPAVSRKLFSPATVTSLGPTPQRDGKVLGLFDLLVEKELGTPSRRHGEGGGSGGKTGSLPLNLQSTPGKRRSSFDDDGIAALGRTPTSKRQRGNLFATPLKKKDGRDAGTPTSVSKLTFETPAFLKRHSLPTVDENSSFDVPAPLRLPRKPFARGLSEIVASLRRVEEEQADEDLEALREAEGGDFGGEPELGKPIPPKPKPKEPEAILESDSQAMQLLGGFDDEGMYDSPVEEDGNPLRVFKKKGQKRTTRRSNMKPTRHKRPAVSTENGNGIENEEDEEEEAVTTAQTGGAGGSDDEFVDENDDGDDAKSKKSTKKKPSTAAGVVKKAARKVNELAHANFQRLKLRNHGAKGGPGHNSRFRRRR